MTQHILKLYDNRFSTARDKKLSYFTTQFKYDQNVEQPRLNNQVNFNN
jgi:hypothetical protein